MARVSSARAQSHALSSQLGQDTHGAQTSVLPDTSEAAPSAQGHGGEWRRSAVYGK